MDTMSSKGPLGKKILIIEDEPALLRALVDGFKDAGFDVSGSESGAEGLKICFAEHPDLVILDILMPQMDGLTILGKLREDPWGRSVPVIILTNVNDDKVKDFSMTQGISYFFVKSDWSLEEIVSKVKDRLQLS